MFKKLKNKKGFTLIEIIVVIVILAVLMAVAVPSVMSYMNEGKNAKYQTAARTVLIDAQTQYAKGVADGANDTSAVNKAKSYIEHKSYTGDITVSNVTITVAGGSGDAAEKDVTLVTCKIKIDDNTKNVTINANKKVTVENAD